MKQSKRLISERRVRAAIFEEYDERNPDNKPREISQEVIDALDEVVRSAISCLVVRGHCQGGRLQHKTAFHIDYWGDA